MKLSLVGIALILYGISLILSSSGSAYDIGQILSFVGLIITIVSYAKDSDLLNFMRDKDIQ